MLETGQAGRRRGQRNKRGKLRLATPERGKTEAGRSTASWHAGHIQTLSASFQTSAPLHLAHATNPMRARGRRAASRAASAGGGTAWISANIGCAPVKLGGRPAGWAEDLPAQHRIPQVRACGAKRRTGPCGPVMWKIFPPSEHVNRKMDVFSIFLDQLVGTRINRRLGCGVSMPRSADRSRGSRPRIEAPYRRAGSIREVTWVIGPMMRTFAAWSWWRP